MYKLNYINKTIHWIKWYDRILRNLILKQRLLTTSLLLPLFGAFSSNILFIRFHEFLLFSRLNPGFIKQRKGSLNMFETTLVVQRVETIPFQWRHVANSSFVKMYPENSVLCS